ncbi:hypothetical protein T440DRAFT_137692 [Plenodomus tracheiphilus IPT5]|uniref:Uncharacterized protein n=1 Tax=Plenodomus tracheiphilus IPT5 TaxID=1408161 RepID=A0A6A7B0N5_9PLEO|nr:hypothetical protein T440DRAFT_137692 [Plenodomus tracheiphilus IPT5]
MLSSSGGVSKEAFPTQAGQASRRRLGIATLVQKHACWSDMAAFHTPPHASTRLYAPLRACSPSNQRSGYCKRASQPTRHWPTAGEIAWRGDRGRVRLAASISSRAGRCCSSYSWSHGALWSWAPAIRGWNSEHEGCMTASVCAPTPQICARYQPL